MHKAYYSYLLTKSIKYNKSQILSNTSINNLNFQLVKSNSGNVFVHIADKDQNAELVQNMSDNELFADKKTLFIDQSRASFLTSKFKVENVENNIYAIYLSAKRGIKYQTYDFKILFNGDTLICLDTAARRAKL